MDSLLDVYNLDGGIDLVHLSDLQTRHRLRLHRFVLIPRTAFILDNLDTTVNAPPYIWQEDRINWGQFYISPIGGFHNDFTLNYLYIKRET